MSDYHAHLLNLVALDKEAFTALIQKLGYAAAAFYRLKDQKIIHLLGTEVPDGAEWPACVGYDLSYYTPNTASSTPMGWFRLPRAKSVSGAWPRGTLFYYPEQSLWSAKFALAVVPHVGARLTVGELDGPLEATTRRLARWVDSGDLRHFISDTEFLEQARRLNLDIQGFMDHVLRTPLSSIVGYAALLEAGGHTEDVAQSFVRVIQEQSNVALQAVEKLSLALSSSAQNQSLANSMAPVDLNEMIESLATEFPAQRGRKQIDLRVVTAGHVMVRGVTQMLRQAVSEVLHNAVVHSNGTVVNVSLYVSEDTAILDITDDGTGVPVGSDDLIFLRFFQAPSSQSYRRGQRGLGWGLYLARHIAEQHFGQLLFVRGTKRGGTFRFILPLELAFTGQRPA